MLGVVPEEGSQECHDPTQMTAPHAPPAASTWGPGSRKGACQWKKIVGRMLKRAVFDIKPIYCFSVPDAQLH